MAATVEKHDMTHSHKWAFAYSKTNPITCSTLSMDEQPRTGLENSFRVELDKLCQRVAHLEPQMQQMNPKSSSFTHFSTTITASSSDGIDLPDDHRRKSLLGRCPYALSDYSCCKATSEDMQYRLISMRRESVGSRGWNGNPSAFCCCSSDWVSIGELLDHVSAEHGMQRCCEAAAGKQSFGESHPRDNERKNGSSSGAQAESPVGLTSSVAVKDFCGSASSTQASNPVGDSSDVKESASMSSTREPNKTRAVVCSSGSKPWSDVSDPTESEDVAHVGQPPLLKSMRPPTSVHICNRDTFTKKLINYTFGGHLWSPGFYWVPDSGLLKGCAYWIIDTENDPFGPLAPGTHGAKLSGVSRTLQGNQESQLSPQEWNYLDTPVFAKISGEKGYMYMGQYSRLPGKNTIDLSDLLVHVSLKLREFWAEQLAHSDRPQWATKNLLSQLVSSISPGGDQSHKSSETIENINQYSKEDFANMFDSGTLPMHLEYLECVGYDDGLYEFMLQTKHIPRLRRPAAASRRVRSGPAAQSMETPRESERKPK